jgi:hypothetical protein
MDETKVFLPITRRGEALDQALVKRHSTLVDGTAQSPFACLAFMDGGGHVETEAFLTEMMATITGNLRLLGRLLHRRGGGADE